MRRKPTNDKKQENVPKKKVRLGRIAIILGILVYLLLFTHAFFGQMIKTYIVDYGKIEDSNSVTGYIIRTEEIIVSNLPGAVDPVKKEGERVAKGNVVATVYKGSTKQIEESIANTEKRIQEAIKDQESNKLGTHLFSEDLIKLDGETDKKISEIYSLIDGNNFVRLTQLKKEIDENLRKRAEISGQFGPASNHIKNLKNEKETYEQRLAALRENIRANFAGVVSYNVDGLEGVLVPQSIPKFTARQLTALCNDVEGKKPSGTNTLKIVDNFECYIAAVIEDKKRITQLENNKWVWVRFGNAGDELIPAQIYHVSVESDSKALLTLKINEKVEDLLNIRKTDIDIIWSTCKGLKIPLTSMVKHMFVTAVVNNKEEVEKVKVGERFSLKIAGIGDKSVPATVYYIQTDKDNRVTIDIKLDTKLDGLYDGKEVSVLVERPDNPDLKFPKTLEATCDEREGVLAVRANYTQFREIEIKKQNNEYAIIDDQTSRSRRGISLYDEIILNGANVEEGRQIRRWND